MTEEERELVERVRAVVTDYRTRQRKALELRRPEFHAEVIARMDRSEAAPILYTDLEILLRLADRTGRP
ncbi:MAG TPA: hypothetical protein VFQ67_00960 [Allosphingosinicella sp.]|jgi:hypothetical protein|nr:hypothetical protein [Allosphingosinicella sp.]